MRSLSILWRMAEDMRRMAMMSPFHEDPITTMHRLTAPLSQLYRLERREPALPKLGKDGYQVSLDVSQYQPNELTVKAIDDNTVVIEGKYEERPDDEHGGFLSKHFVRRFTLPNGYKAEQAVPTLSSDGVLTVNVPKPPEFIDEASERVLPIHQTGPAYMSIKENPAEDDTATASKKPKA